MNCNNCQFYDEFSHNWGRCALSLSHYDKKQKPDDDRSPFYAVGWREGDEAETAVLYVNGNHGCKEFTPLPTDPPSQDDINKALIKKQIK